MRIGVIGAGISGLLAAWLLQEEHEVCLFEKLDRLGGHAHTIEVEQDGVAVPIDAAVEFFAGVESYPQFHRVLAALDVPLRQFPISTTIFHTNKDGVVLLPPWRDGK